jgi:hypothetical protein
VPRGRLSFEPAGGPDGQAGAAPFGSVLFLYGVVTDAEINSLKTKGFQLWRS